MIRLVTIFAVFLALVVAPLALAQSDSDSKIEQQITPNLCSYTTIETGFGVVHDSTCPVFAPTVERINLNGGRPIITGIYDAIHSINFRVQVANKWYVLDSSSELTTNGNVWMLDLSKLDDPLPVGRYDLIVEMAGDDNKVREVRAVVVVPPIGSSQGKTDPETPSKGDETEEEGEVQPPTDETDDSAESPVDETEARRISLLPLAVTLLASLIISWFLLAARKKRRKKDQKA